MTWHQIEDRLLNAILVLFASLMVLNGLVGAALLYINIRGQQP